MSPAEKQQQLIARYGLIEDFHERLALLVERVRTLAPLPESERCDRNRVQGCASRVWLVAELAGDVCRFKIDADSTLVRGLTALICELYDGASPAAICAHEPTLLEALHLTDHLSPTRRHGLQRVSGAIHNFAAGCLAR